MSSLRDKQKNHIRAAREWLGEAETSLECENDVQSDLKLMLARAELSRVKDTPATSRLKARALKVLPAVCAALIVVAGYYLLDGDNAARETSAVTQAVTDATAPARGALPEAVDASAAVAAAERAPLPEVRTDGAVSISADSASPAPLVESTTVAPAASAATSEQARVSVVAEEPSAPVATATETAPAAPPPAEMQQLMQSAGKILRQ